MAKLAHVQLSAEIRKEVRCLTPWQLLLSGQEKTVCLMQNDIKSSRWFMICWFSTVPCFSCAFVMTQGQKKRKKRPTCLLGYCRAAGTSYTDASSLSKLILPTCSKRLLELGNMMILHHYCDVRICRLRSSFYILSHGSSVVFSWF